MPRKTDANSPGDWVWMAQSDLEVIQLAVDRQVGFITCRSKLAETVEKTMKAELIRLGWVLQRTHDLERLLDELVARNCDLVSDFEPLVDGLTDAYFTDRYPGFDLDDPNWPLLTQQLKAAAKLLAVVESRIASP